MTAPRSSGRGREEFDQFVADTTADLLRTGYLVVWDLPAAEDLVQECLLRVARRWPRVRTMDHPAAYARRILINLALDGTRRRTRQRAELDQRDGRTQEERLDEAAGRALGLVESHSELVAALGLLPPRQRVALVLRYFEDLSEAQTAEVLGCSVGTVKSTTWRALERVRQVLAPVPADDHPVAARLVIDTPGGA